MPTLCYIFCDVLLTATLITANVFSIPLQNGIFIESSSTRYTTEGAVFEESDASFLPTFDKHSGFNYFDRDTRILHLASHADTLHRILDWSISDMG